MKFCLIVPLLLLGIVATSASALDVQKEIQRADDFGNRTASLLVRNKVRTYWSPGDSHLIYRVNITSAQHQFFQVDLVSGVKSLAFDHILLATALGKAAEQNVDPNTLPIEQIEVTTDALRFRAFGKSWRYTIAEQQVTPDDLPPKGIDLLPPESGMRSTRRKGEETALSIENATPGEIEMFWVDQKGERKSYGKLPAGQIATQQTYAGHFWLVTDASGQPLAGVKASAAPSLARITERIRPQPAPKENLSPDGKWRALVLNHNVVIEPTASGTSITLSNDGTSSDTYTRPLLWSPDSKKLVAFREKKVELRQIHIVQSSPPDQLQPKLKTINYPKPGDEIPQPMPHLFDVDNHREIAIDHALFENPWDISETAWANDSSEFSFLYNQRGHQLMRLVGIRSDSGSARTIIEETSKTFIDYSQKTFIHRLPDTREILWASERDGYNHPYLIDEVSGQIKNAVTRGTWNVREVVEVNPEKRELVLKIFGVEGQDPYYAHFAKVNFDGSGFTRLTESDGNHRIDYSPDRKFIIDTWSRVDQPKVVELRRADDGKLVCELERADDSALVKTGWSRPERFTAKGRDGKTDIYGIIIRPVNFDPVKKYPVVEDIYAGPHDFFVTKDYFPWSGKNAMAEMGFIIVSIDGMGTNWRSKAFHDICWKNLMDSGFPDRIPWIKKAALDRPWMDLSRVGIYGGSAGGQSTLAGLLHHGEFYQVGVADCGCHDNRMDKIWWNEAWMGWPIDESYERNANVTHVGKLTGKLMLMVGEVDTNVDPASTAQVVNALEKANKDFDFLPIMNSDHGAAETPYGNRRRAEFLVRHLSAPAKNGN